MSRLEELINEYCPDGVEIKMLSSITSAINIGVNPRKFFKLNPDDADGFYVTVRELNGLSGVRQYDKTDRINSDAVRMINERANIDAGDILFSNTGTVGKLALINEKPDNWSVNEGIYVIKPLQTHIDSKYLYYYLDSDYAYKEYSKKYTGSTLKHVTQKAMLSLKVPVPPLEVQREIVRILDNYSAVVAEMKDRLADELTARKKQYEYYKKELLSFDKDIEWGTLADVGKVSMCKRIMKRETSDNGDVPFFKIGTFGKQANAYISQKTFDEYKERFSYPKKGDILISAAGTIGRTVVFDGEPAYFQDSNIVWIANDETKVLNEFLYYWYQTNPWKVSTGGTIARLYNDNISGARVPLLPIETQKAIVDTLKRFDAYINSITEGLPAEIEARQKQYEYYRDKLLTFKEKKQ